MTKRPRLSANLRTPLKSRLAEGPEQLDAAGVSPAPETPPRSDARERPSPAAVSSASVHQERAADTLPRIFGDAVLAVSLASTFGWTQGLLLQLRLSSYLVGRPQSDRPTR